MSAPEPGRAAAPTPGQAAYEGSLTVIADDFDGEPWAWESLTPKLRASWEAAAQAVLNQAFPGLRRQLDEARAELKEVRKLAGNLERDRNALLDGNAQIARERDQLRELAAEMADDIEHLIGGNAGYIDRDMVAGYRERAGIEVTP